MTAPLDSGPTRPPLLDLKFGAADSARLRLSVEAGAIQAGLAEPHLSRFLLAVHEVVCNAIQHGGGGGHLRLQRDDGVLRCHVIDAGPGFGDRFGDRFDDQGSTSRRPDINAETGRGLWLAHQLADQVTISTGCVGSAVSLTVALSEPGEIDELGGRRRRPPARP